MHARSRIASLLLAALASTLAGAACGARSSLSLEGGDDDGGGGGDGGTCRPGSVVVPDGDADRAAVDGDDVYFTVTRNGVGAVVRASIDEPGAYVDVIGDLVQPNDITVARGALWVSDEGRIQRVPLDGGAASTFYAGPDAQAFDLVADDAGLYWMALGGGTIWFQGYDATSPKEVVSGVGELRGLALFGLDVIFTARTIPFGDGEQNVIAAIPKAGGGISVLAAERQQPTSIMQVGTRIGWLEVNPLNGAPLGVYTMPRDGSAGPTLLVGPPEGTFPLVARADGDFVAMVNYDRVSESVLVGASLRSARREIDRRDEVFGEPAIAPGFVAWTVLPSGVDPDAVDLRWVCR